MPKKKRRHEQRRFVPEAIANASLVVGWGLAIGFGVLYYRSGDDEMPPPVSPGTEQTSSIDDQELPETAAVEPRFEELERTLVDVSGQDGMLGSTIVACVLDGAGNAIYSFGGERSFVPASTLKTVTTATILEKLGPGFRFRTLLKGTAPLPRKDAPPEKGVYTGDIVIIGGGDPSLTTDILVEWGAKLADMGIQKVDGRIIGDGKVFPENTASKAWDWGDVGNYYGAPVAGLNIDRNLYVARLRPGDEIGVPAVLMEMTPEVPGVTVINRILTAAESGERDPLYAYAGPYSDTITFRGDVPLDSKEEILEGATPDPVFAASSRLHRILKQRGIDVTGDPTTSRRLELEGVPALDPESLHTGLTHLSQPLIDLIKHTHLVSDNVYAECFFRLLGLAQSDRSGQSAVVSHWEQRGLSIKGLRMEDGSGLARADLIRAVDLAKINFLARSGQHGDAFLDSLTPQMEGKMRWKGGAMSRVRAYVGFAPTAEEDELTFVLGFNNYDADSVTIAKARERILKLLLTL